MTDLRVLKGGDYSWTNISIDKNVTISNRRDLSKKLKSGEVEAKIQDGEVYTKRRGNNDSDEDNLSFDRLSLSEKKYNIFMEICKLDGNDKTFTQQDAILATQLNKETLKTLGIIDIVKDFSKGIIKLILGGGENDVLTFDFETKEEMKHRKEKHIVEEDTNFWDLSFDLGVDPYKLLKKNPKYHTPESWALKDLESSDSGKSTIENIPVKEGNVLKLPPYELTDKDHKLVWDDKY